MQQEYNTQSHEQDIIMEAYFVMPCSDRLRQTLKHMQQWLKQVEAGRTRQSIVKEATAKIRQLQGEGQFVETDSILTMSNREMSQWISRKFRPSADTKKTLHHFFLPRK